MEISIKDTLKQLRQKKNVTQETLARHLGITPQSVGKWERGEGYPDITLLPAIALYFGVTVDELLNVDQARIEEKISAYFRESADLCRAGEVAKDLALWERAHAEFPNDCSVMLKLAQALQCAPLIPGKNDDPARTIALCERILAESADANLIMKARNIIVLCCRRTGDMENALRHADQLPELTWCTRDNSRAEILDGEDGIKEAQQYLARCIFMASTAAQILASKPSLSSEEKIAALTVAAKLTEVPFSDGNYGKAAHTLSMFYGMLSIEYAQRKDAERTLDSLEAAAKYAIIADQHPSGTYTTPVFNRISYEESPKTYTGTLSELRLKQLRWGNYRFISEDERFRRMEAELQKIAK